jgi:histidinol-phosphate aminotransferase
MFEPRAVFERLQTRGIIVRDRSKERGCEGCLRITVGTSDENVALLDALREIL